MYRVLNLQADWEVKEALVDKINWYFVPDPSTRVNGLLSGQYDYAHYLSYDSVPQVKNTPGFKVDIWPYGNEILVFNKSQAYSQMYELDKRLILH